MKLLGSHIITSPLLSCLKTTSICSHFWRRWQWIWEQGMNWCNFAEVRKIGEGNQEGFDDFWRDRSSWASSWVFDDFLSVTQVKLLLDCASLCQGVDIVCQKDCIMLFELARISKIFGWVQRIFCFNSSNKLHTTLDKTSTDRTDPVSRLML